MLTFEKVLEIFEDYLAQDMEWEVYKSRYGYVCVSFNGSPPDPPYCEGDVCRTPEELFDHLLVEYKSFVSIQLTKGRREENEADEEQVRRLCQKYLDRREEAMNDRIEAGFEDCDCAGDPATHPGYLDLRGVGLCVRLGAGASQYGDRPAGRGRPGDILPAERPYSVGDRVSHKPLWAAEVSLLAAGQGAGSSVFSARYNLWIE